MEREKLNPEPPSAAIFADLRKLIDEELGELRKENLTRAFHPITDGLGLESPRKIENPFMEPESEIPAIIERQSKETAQVAPPNLPPDEKPSKPMALASVIAGNSSKENRKPIPPPLPKPSSLRRMLGALVDEVFVLSLWYLALFTTGKLLAETMNLELGRGLVLQSPLFLKFAALEFAILWIFYFALCLGVLDMTFGMWVWGVRVAYGKAGGSRFFKKLRRILLSLFFYAPIIPLVLLIFRRKGRNLLDVLSGTSLLKAPV